MVSIGMCEHCRRCKQKCTPSQRTWVEGGEKQKCERCLRYNHECGPNERLPRRRPRRRSSPSQQQALPPPLPPSRAGPSITSPVRRELNDASVEDLLDFAEGDVRVEDDKQELRRRMADLDVEVEARKQLQLGIEYLERNNRQLEPHYGEMTSLKNASTRVLSSKLVPAEAWADRVYAAHEIEAAENAYTRILNVYRMMDIKAWHEVHGLLLKMANISWKMGEPVRTENLLWEALELGGIHRQAQQSDLRLLKNLARSLPRTSKEISKVVQDMVIGPMSSNLTMSLPPVQRMMESKYASDVVGNIFQTGSLATLELFSPPIIGGMEAIRKVIQEVPEADLLAADSHGRTPLYMATDLQKERFGLALLLHTAGLPNISPKQFTNARDKFGQTILGIATWRRCSLEYMESLIDHGAEVDPETLTEFVLTPLQVASGLGYSEIVDLLLRHGAKPGRIYPGPESKTPETLAQDAGHVDIVQKLQSYVAG